MTRRIFIYLDYGRGVLYASPEFNGDKTEYAHRGGALDSCDLTTEELFGLFEVKTLSDFQNACVEAQSCYHSFLDESGTTKKEFPITMMELFELPHLCADELIFILEDGKQIVAPDDWDGRMESLYERVQTLFQRTVSLAQALNRLLTGQGCGYVDYCEGVIISKEESAIIDGYLNAQTEDEYQGEGSTISRSVIFPDGKWMDVKCCGCQDEPSWTEAVLFDQHGREVACSEVSDEFEGTWDLKHDGILYTAIMKTEGGRSTWSEI